MFIEEIQTIVARLKEKNIGILITDHNVQETLSITDRAYLLFEGKILSHVQRIIGKPLICLQSEWGGEFTSQ